MVFQLLRHGVLRAGDLDQWPSFRDGGEWEIPAYVDPKTERKLKYLGHWTRDQAKALFEEAADEAEQLWGVRPIQGGGVPSEIPVDPWISILKRVFGQD
jgi:hypothetical protein